MQRSILPIGKTNFKTGRCKYFNIFETWANSETTVELWLTTDNQWKAIITAGVPENESSDKKEEFFHDQTLRFMFNAHKVMQAKLSDSEALKNIFEKATHKITAYVYK